MSSEEMYRAANVMDSAADTMRTASGIIDDSVRRLEILFGEGYGGLVERLVIALEEQNKMLLKLSSGNNP